MDRVPRQHLGQRAVSVCLVSKDSTEPTCNSTAEIGLAFDASRDVPGMTKPGDDDAEEGGCASTLREEFRCRNFGLSHPKPRLFVSDQWGYPKVYVAWRVFWALYHVGWILYNWADDAVITERPGTWFIYLTNWNYFLLTANTVLQAVVVLYVTRGQPDLEGDMTPWYLKMTWIVYEMASVGSILVTILYFALLFNGTLPVISTQTHLLNSVYVILDVCVTATPVRLLHGLYITVYGVIYMVFSLIYWAAGGVNEDGKPYIYESLGWSQAKRAAPLAVGAVVIGVPLVHTPFWTMHMIRRALCRKVCGSRNQRTGRISGSDHTSSPSQRMCADTDPSA